MRLSKLSSLLAAQGVLSLAVPIAFAQSAVAGSGASQTSGTPASQASGGGRAQESAPLQRWDGLDPGAVKRVSERESKPKVPAFRAESR